MASKKKDKKDKKNKPPKPLKKRNKTELLAAVVLAQARLTAALAVVKSSASSYEAMMKCKDERINDLEAKLIPARAIAEAIQRDCPPGTRCNALVNVIYYPCGTSQVVPTQRDWWLSLLKE